MEMDFMEITEKYQIFCDMDGVLVDLVGGVGKALYEDAPADASANYIKVQQKAQKVLDGQSLLPEHLDKTNPNEKRDTQFLVPSLDGQSPVLDEPGVASRWKEIVGLY